MRLSAWGGWYERPSPLPDLRSVLQAQRQRHTPLPAVLCAEGKAVILRWPESQVEPLSDADIEALGLALGEALAKEFLRIEAESLSMVSTGSGTHQTLRSADPLEGNTDGTV